MLGKVFRPTRVNHNQTPQQAREAATIRSRNHRIASKAKAFAHLGDRCCRCGFTDVRALQVDHVRGDGWKLRGMGIIGTNMYKDVLLTIPGHCYQLLCANCNAIKRHENNEHVRPWKHLLE